MASSNPTPGHSSGPSSGSDPRPNSPKDSPGSFLRQLSLAMELPFIMIATVLIGGVVGYFLDRSFHTSPALTLLGGFLGFGAGIWDIIRRLAREEKR